MQEPKKIDLLDVYLLVAFRIERMHYSAPMKFRAPKVKKG